MWCPECESLQVGEMVRFCSHCGGRMVEEKAKCPKCGEEVMLWDKFCPGCGRPIQAEMRAILQERLKREDAWDK